MSRRYDPAAALVQYFGAHILTCLVGDDLIMSGTNVVSWPARIGGAATYVAGSSSAQQSLTLRGRAALSISQNATQCTLNCVCANPLTLVAVLSPAAIPFPNYLGAVVIKNKTADSNAIIGSPGTSNIYVGGKWSSHWVDGISGVAVTAAQHTVEASASTSGGSDLYIGGDPGSGPSRNWAGTILMVLAFDIVLDAPGRAAYLGIVNTYNH